MKKGKERVTEQINTQNSRPCMAKRDVPELLHFQTRSKFLNFHLFPGSYYVIMLSVSVWVCFDSRCMQGNITVPHYVKHVGKF